MESGLSPTSKLLPLFMRGIRVIAFFFGMINLIFGSILFWGVSAAENSLHSSAKGVLWLCVVCVWFAFSMFICLWSVRKQSAVNYLRLLVFPPAVLVAMQFEDGPAFGLFYAAMVFLAIVVFWNFALLVVERSRMSGKRGRELFAK
jgi:hypothetical protein